jgi:NADPH2:quinone reductase
VDVVIDPVGGVPAEAALRAMAWCGRLVVVGFASGAVPSFRSNYLLVKGLTAGGFQWTDYRDRQPERVRQAQAEILDLWQAGRLDPMISRLAPLESIVEALTEIRDGRTRGKIVLQVGR